MAAINNTGKILQRVDTLPLHPHVYAFHLNIRLKRVLPADLLDITGENDLRGVKIHILNDGRFSLSNMGDKELSAFEGKVRCLSLSIHIGASTSDKTSTDEAIAIALETGASSVRFYPRYEDSLRDVLSIIADDIAYVRETYQDSGLTFAIEQREDLKSHELVLLVKESEMESLSLLFNSANMISAGGHPIDALKMTAPHTTQVHIKDALVVREQDSLGHKACTSDQNDVLFKALLTYLICLDDDGPQVTTYNLEEEVGYYAPAFHFEDEGDNPWIPCYQINETSLSEDHLPGARLCREKGDAINQIGHIRDALQQVKQEANHLLNH